MRGRRPSTGEILQLFKAAGFDAFTPLQRKLIPVMLSGKDAAVKAAAGAGSTAGFLAPLMLMLRGPQAGLKALILVTNPEKIRKVALLYTRFSRVMREPPVLFTLGETEDARREQRRLERTPAMIVGTAERVIDHLRRGSVTLDRLAYAVVEQPRGEFAEDFVRDVQFIFAKLPRSRQTVLLEGPGIEPPGQLPGGYEEDALHAILRRPVPVSPDAAPASTEAPRNLYFEVAAADKEALLQGFILARGPAPAFVFHSPRTNGEALARGLCSSGVRAAALAPGAGSTARGRLFSSFFRGELEVLLVPLPAPPECDPSRASLLVYYDLPSQRAAGAREAARRAGGVVAFLDRNQARDLAKLQDAYGVSMKKEEVPGRSDVINGFMERILGSIKAGENLGEIIRLRAIIRKRVPFLMRSYVSAYLLRSQLPRILGPAAEGGQQEPRGRQKGRPRSEPGGERTQTRGGRPMTARAASGASAADFQKQEPQGRGGFIQLFVSIGRNRRVFPRDLGDFFSDRLKLRQDEIGGVRVFDKYSFVEISPARAEEAISKLSGAEFKGKTITVNYAKKKEEKEGS